MCINKLKGKIFIFFHQKRSQNYIRLDTKHVNPHAVLSSRLRKICQTDSGEIFFFFFFLIKLLLLMQMENKLTVSAAVTHSPSDHPSLAESSQWQEPGFCWMWSRPDLIKLTGIKCWRLRLWVPTPRLRGTVLFFCFMGSQGWDLKSKDLHENKGWNLKTLKKSTVWLLSSP